MPREATTSDRHYVFIAKPYRLEELDAGRHPCPVRVGRKGCDVVAPALRVRQEGLRRRSSPLSVVRHRLINRIALTPSRDEQPFAKPSKNTNEREKELTLSKYTPPCGFTNECL